LFGSRRRQSRHDCLYGRSISCRGISGDLNFVAGKGEEVFVELQQLFLAIREVG
jgi:hypothetical protein